MGTSLIHINAAIGRQIVDTYSMGVSAAGCLAVALILNSALSLIMLAIIPVVLVIMLIMNYFIRKAKKRSNAELAEAGSIATEVIAGIKIVAALCAQPWFRTNYDNHIGESEKYSIEGSFLSSLLSGITGMIFYFAYCYAFYIGTEQVISGASSATIIKCHFSSDPNCRVTGVFVMCCIYGVILCVTFIGLMTPGITSINLGRQAAVEVFDVIHRTPTIDPASEQDGNQLKSVEGRIEFQNVFFYYPSQPNKFIFHNFNWTIEPGQSVALVGPSGSGKSTIARFLLRFYDPNSFEKHRIPRFGFCLGGLQGRTILEHFGGKLGVLG
jgi:ABC-type multidrug transport system fused ATPase/permease subunit